MTRNFDDRIFTPSTLGFYEEFVEDEWIHARHLHIILEPFTCDTIPHRREHEDLLSCSFEALRDDIGRRRLPFAAGNSDHDHISGWIAIDVMCQKTTQKVVKNSNRTVESDETSECIDHKRD